MECYGARFASFSATHAATKKRASDLKGSRPLQWPHKRPSPPQLAAAGFYYHPTPSCPDNVVCYLCRSSLDGWEETDDPIDEHLSHSRSCGWAICAFAEGAIENGYRDLADPLSEGMLEARRMTFAAGWPHENKRGWLCKTQKMIEAGWHYCPTQESDDFVRCSYCSLSLDGWEPKDNPYEEHKRRSPDCIVFASINASKPKGAKGRKARASKASRLSSMSNVTVASETLSVEDAEVAIDDSMVSTATVSKPAKRKGGKKSSKAKKSTPCGKVVEKITNESMVASSYIEPEDDDFSVKVDQTPEPMIKGRKRKSNQISAANGEEVKMREDAETQLPAKRRATRTRNSVLARAQPSGDVPARKDEDTEMTDAETNHRGPAAKQGRKGVKKRASSTTRKASMMSTASKASLRDGVPDDGDLDAAPELDLNRPLTEDEYDIDTAEAPLPKGRRLTRTKPGFKKATASVASTRKRTRASTLPADKPVDKPDRELELEPLTDQDIEKTSEASSELRKLHNDEGVLLLHGSKRIERQGNGKPAAKRKAPTLEDDLVPEVVGAHSLAEIGLSDQAPPKRQPKSRQASRQVPSRTKRMSVLSTAQHSEASQLDSSKLDAELLLDDPDHETDASVNVHGGSGRSGPEKTMTTKKGKKSAKAQSANRNIKDIVKPQSQPDEVIASAPIIDDQRMDEPIEVEVDEERPLKSKQKPKAGKTASKSGKGRKGASKAKALTKEPSPAPLEADAPLTPAAPEVQPTPAASPQSSDAENQPPSSRPTQLRPPLTIQSPFRSQATLVPLAVSTPTHSPPKNTFSKLQTAAPWTAVDLERIFQGTPGAGKENDYFALGVDTVKEELTSPEKRLTVEQWIQYNAQRGEEKLRAECERMVGKFEGEGMRALRALEGIECAE